MMEWVLTVIGLLLLLVLLIWQHVLHQRLLSVTRQLEQQTAYRGRIPASQETLHCN